MRAVACGKNVAQVYTKIVNLCNIVSSYAEELRVKAANVISSVDILASACDGYTRVTSCSNVSMQPELRKLKFFRRNNVTISKTLICPFCIA